MYAKVREHGAPVQGARLGGTPESDGGKDSQPANSAPLPHTDDTFLHLRDSMK